MSETLRTLEGTDLSARRRGYGGRGRGRLVLLVAVVLVGLYVWRATRDTYPIERVIPANQAYQAFANDLLGKRDRLAESRIWGALPEPWGSKVKRALGDDLPVPPWILNNLAPGVCHVSGNDLKEFGDVLVVTRMSWMGTLLMKAQRFFPRVYGEPAGGLHLSRVADAGVYFAVRGRLLIVSRSRDALIRSLTLREEDALKPGNIAEALAEAGREDLRGTVSFAPDDPLGDVFKSISFALRVDAKSAGLKCRAALRREWESRGWQILADLTPKKLLAPPKGLLEISLDTDKNIRQLWSAVGEIANASEKFNALWNEWAGPPREGASKLPQMATAFFGPLGPGLRASWLGIDMNEMVPAPELVFTIDGAPDVLLNAFSSIPPLPDTAQYYDMIPRFDPDTKCVWIPLVGGPSLEPTAAAYGKTLLVSSSRTVAERLIHENAPLEELPQPGNVFIRVRPKPCVEAVVNLANEIAQYGILRDWTTERIQREAKPWLDAAANIGEVSAQAAYGAGEISAEANIVCAEDVRETEAAARAEKQ